MYRVLYLSLIVYGAFSQITQALLIREDLVVFYGNEISLGVFFGSWLLWIAAAIPAPVARRSDYYDPCCAKFLRYLIDPVHCFR